MAESKPHKFINWQLGKCSLCLLPREHPVHEVQKVAIPIQAQVIADMAARWKGSYAEHDNHLLAGRGRSALQDAYEEALDLCMYLKKALIEEELRGQNQPGHST